MFKNKRVIVAFSGGVDSTVVAFLLSKIANSVLLVIQDGDSLASGEIENARNVAKQLNLGLHVIKYNEFEESVNYAQNPANRCYYCKQLLHSKLEQLRVELSYDVVVNGTNYSDLSGHRPGYKAISELGAATPLADFKLTKEEIRTIAHENGLTNWNKPSLPCLASRVYTGVKIDQDILKRVDSSESYLRQNFEFRILRVRDLGNDEALIQVSRDEIGILSSNIDRIKSILKKFGYKEVSFDPNGYSPYVPPNKSEII